MELAHRLTGGGTWERQDLALIATGEHRDQQRQVWKPFRHARCVLNLEVFLSLKLRVEDLTEEAIPMNQKSIFNVFRHFDDAPNSMLIDIGTAATISRRSRASIYRHIKAGDLELVKVGSSSRIRIGDLRQLIKAKDISTNAIINTDMHSSLCNKEPGRLNTKVERAAQANRDIIDKQAAYTDIRREVTSKSFARDSVASECTSCGLKMEEEA